MKDRGHDLIAAVGRLFSCCIPLPSSLGDGGRADHQDEPASMGHTTKMKMKLAVDRSRNRVLFADAGSDVVDILLSLLTVPLSAIHIMAGLSSSPVCLTNLFNSLNHLSNNDLLKADACLGMFPMPMLSDGFRLCKPPCNHSECKCCDALFRLMSEHGALWEAPVRGKERFVISDDWRIKPASTTSLMQMLGADRISHDFEEVEVCVGWREIVSMLKASLSSDTIFTDVFLSKGDHSARRVTAKPSINQNIVHPASREDSDSSLESKIKIFYDMREKKVMYAECDHGLVDLLLGFLTYPLCRVIKNGGAAGTFHISRSLNNLYSSAMDLGATGFLRGLFPEETSSPDPGLAPFPELVEDRKYIVEDDLLIHQASATSVMKHWSGKRSTHVTELSMTIRKHEAVAVLMQAVFTSKTALTDAFIRRKETMQIFVRIGTAKTITLNKVASSDTIASVRRKIEDKLGGAPSKALHINLNSKRLCFSLSRSSQLSLTSGHGFPVPRELPLRLPPPRPGRHAVPGRHRHWPGAEAQHRRVPHGQVRPRRRQGLRPPRRALPRPRQHPRRPHRAGPRRAPGRVPQLRARAAPLRHDRRRPAPGGAAAEHPAAQDPVHELGPRAHEEGARAAGRRRGLLRRRRLLRDHEPAPLRGCLQRHRPHGRRLETVRRRHRRRPARRRHEPTPNALPRRQREEHRGGESPRPTHSPGWQEGEEQGCGLRAGEHWQPAASHPGDLGRRRRRAAARPQRGEEQEHEGRAGRRHPAHVDPGLIISRVLISNSGVITNLSIYNASLIMVHLPSRNVQSCKLCSDS